MKLRCTMLSLILSLFLPAAVRAEDPAQAQLVQASTKLRIEIKRLETAEAGLAAERDRQDASLKALSARITQRKASQADRQPGLLPDYELQRLLRQSQQLSAALTALNRELDAMEQIKAGKLRELAGVLERWTAATRAALKSAPDAEKKSLLGTLARLRAERQRLAEVLNPPRSGSDLSGHRDLLASDDPEELGERLDAVRDEQDRMRRHLKHLEQLMAQRRNDRRLEQEMNDFIADQDLFAEQARRLILNQPKAAVVDGAGDDRQGEFGGGTDASPNEGTWDGTDPASAIGGENDVEPSSPAEPYNSGGLLDRPVGVDGPEPEGAEPDEMNMEQLARQRAEIVTKLKQLQQLTDRLQEKIESLEP